MPSAPQRSCNAPGCGLLCDGGSYCPRHKRETSRQHDQQRGNSAIRGYDADHRKLRVLCFQRDAWRCSECGWEPEIVADFRCCELGDAPAADVLEELRQRRRRGERHLHADHRIPIAVRPDLRLVLDNLQTLCDGCHSRKTLRERAV